MSKLRGVYFLSFLFLLLTGCLKTTDQIEREKKVDSLDDEIHQSQKNTADLTLQVKDLYSKLAKTNGEIEELNYKQSKNSEKGTEESKKTIQVLSEQIKELQADLKKQQELTTTLSSQVQAHKEFIDELTKTMSKGHHAEKSKNKDEENKVSTVDDVLENAFALYRSKKYEEAKAKFNLALENKELSAKNTNKANLHLGLIEFKQKKYEEALVYLSKVYTQFPNSSIAPGALLFIGKSFKGLKKLEEAEASFSELVEKYASSKEAEEAKKELKK